MSTQAINKDLSKGYLLRGNKKSLKPPIVAENKEKKLSHYEMILEQNKNK